MSLEMSALDHPILEESEIRELVSRYQTTGDKEAADRIIRFNQRMIYTIARRYHASGVCGDVTIEDLMQYGMMGMLKAIQMFDLDRGFKFTTYAYWWTHQQISRYGKHDGQQVSLSFQASERRGRIGSIRAAFEQTHGREPSQQELSEISGMSLEKIESLRVNVISLDVEVDEEDDTRTMLEMITDDSVNVAQEAESAVLLASIRDCLPRLTANQRQVIILRFGLDGGGARGLRRAGEDLGISDTRVKQLEDAALERLRKYLLKGFISG